MSNKASETIFSGDTFIIPMAEISHIMKIKHGGFEVVTAKTTLHWPDNMYNNSIVLSQEEGEKLLKAWCFYRHEVDGPFKDPEE